MKPLKSCKQTHLFGIHVEFLFPTEEFSALDKTFTVKKIKKKGFEDSLKHSENHCLHMSHGTTLLSYMCTLTPNCV